MLPKMSEENKTTEPFIVISQNEVSYPGVHSKSHPIWKCIIIAVSAVLVVALILTAILVAMYLFTQGQKDILQFSYNRDENTKEEVISDPNANFVQYHITNTEYEMWVIDDFNRDIKAMKVKTEDSVNCYVFPLNRTTATDPSKVTGPQDIKRQDDSNVMTYRPYNSPVPDIALLSKEARDACQGISTHWIYPTFKDQTEHSLSREKRQSFCVITTICIEWSCGDVTVCVCMTWIEECVTPPDTTPDTIPDTTPETTPDTPPVTPDIPDATTDK